MKNDFNQFTKRDMPLDASIAFSSTPDHINKTNLKFNAIGKKANQKNDINNKYLNTNIRQKITKNKKSLKELGKLNEENIRTNQFRTRRNRLIIIILIILLLLACAFIGVCYFVIQLKPNCFVHIDGDGGACYFDNVKQTEFRAPENMMGNRRYEFKLEYKLESNIPKNIKFKIVAYKDDTPLDNLLIYSGKGSNTTGFYEKNGYYCNDSKFSESDGKIILCYGIIIDEKYERSLNNSNFKMDVYVYVY